MKNPIPLIAGFVALALIFSLGAVVLSGILDVQTANSEAANATNNTLGLITGFTGMMPVFGIIAAVILIIFFLTWLYKKNSW